jgi:predicted nuclease of predicted toxin-antitoxin system
MKLLFDQNLSPRLVSALTDLFPGSEHVEEKGLGAASDRAVWNYAQISNLIIVTKDSDFNELSLMLGDPPKIIWTR